MTVGRENRHRRILQKDGPLIIGGSVQLNRVHFSVQLWTNECLVDISGQSSKSAIYKPDMVRKSFIGWNRWLNLVGVYDGLI